MNTLGTVTTNVFTVGPESHKLTITAQAAGAIKEGQQVTLNATGKIVAAAAAAPAYTILGVALKDAVADDYIPVTTSGFYIVEAKAAANSQNAGPIQLGTYSSGVVVAAAAGADDAAKSVVAIGFALDDAASAGDRVRALMTR